MRGSFAGCLGDHFIRTRGCVSCQWMAREVTDFKRVEKWMAPRKSEPDAARFSWEAERGNWRCRGRKCVGNGRNGEVVSALGQRHQSSKNLCTVRCALRRSRKVTQVCFSKL